MVEYLGLVKRVRVINRGKRLARALYLYSNPTYSTVYGIIRPYKNYPSRPQTLAQNKFNKAMSRLQIEVKHEFAFHPNL